MRLADEGAFDDFARVELIEGEIFVVNAQYRPHAAARRAILRALETVLAGRADGLAAVDECSVSLSSVNMPEPDIVLTTEPTGDGPIPRASVRLIVEVADTTLASDLGRKAMLYARHGIAEYWVVDLSGRTVYQLWDAGEAGYAARRQFPFGAPICAETIAGVIVPGGVMGNLN